MSAKRVLIFDSGVGGLSVYEEVIKLNPNIKCNYLFDNANFPYGELPRERLVKRLIQLLNDFMQAHPADLIVIACNSASTIALEQLRTYFTIPIVGVVPAIKPASLITTNNVIGLLATPATVERAYTSTLIDKFAVGKTVLCIGSTQLVKLAEDKLIGKALNLRDFKTILAPWLLENRDNCPDTLVLGCTHFPLLKDEITACFTRPIQLVDSGEAIALRVKQLLLNSLNEGVSISAGRQINQAFYTQDFISEVHCSALSECFSHYGFQNLSLCAL